MQDNYSDLSKEEINQIFLDYINIKSFKEQNNKISYIQFDHQMENGLSLFTNIPECDFDLLEEKIDMITKVLPAINNIFVKPLIHLKEETVVIPVEAVKRIDRNTIQHIYSHSENWENIKNNNVKPLKLQTRIHEDNYGIYENLIFCDTIDEILSFSRRNIRMLKDLILTKQVIELNLLDRVNHLYYFLALGKLHTGYMRFFDNYSDIVQRCYIKLNYLYQEISIRLKRPVYRKNQKRSKYIRLHKTNIFLMHRDYRKIYSLAKQITRNKINEVEITEEKINYLKGSYFYYTEMLCLFSIGHFNFQADPTKKINFDRLDISFEFKKWKVAITTKYLESYKVIQLDICADIGYKIILIPTVSNETNRTKLIDDIRGFISSKIVADEYIICTPYEFEEYHDNEKYISISNVESFRRIQQILLRAMVLSDKKRDECPFCNNKLDKNTELYDDDHYAHTCISCRTTIIDTVCPETNKEYSFTNIFNFHPNILSKENYSKNDMWLYYRKVESQMFFRNITKINIHMDPICPHCNKIHK